MHIKKVTSEKEMHLFGKIMKLIEVIEGMMTLLKQTSGTLFFFFFRSR